MPFRKIVFATNQFYHIFNEAVAGESVFSNKWALELIDFYRFKPQISFSKYKNLNKQEQEKFRKIIFSTPPLVEIYAFSLMPTHFHFLVKQLTDGGISSFAANFQNGFAKYYNLKNKRKGPVFCQMFKGVLIETEEQFLHVSRYIHLNPVTAFLLKIEDLLNYPWTSFSAYMKKIKYDFVETKLIMSYFNSPAHYKEFVFNQEDYQKELAKIKRLALEVTPGV